MVGEDWKEGIVRIHLLHSNIALQSIALAMYLDHGFFLPIWMIFGKIYNGNVLSTCMKKIWGLVLLVFLAMGICTAKVPDLAGNWTGLGTGYFAENGSYKLNENGSVSYNITEQKGRLFTGNITYMLNGTEIVEGLAGVIGLDNKTLYLAEYDKGYDIGTIISNDQIEFMYIEDGDSGWAAINKLHRIK